MKTSILWLAILVAGCAKPAPPPATPMTFVSADNKANHEKQISLEGYARLPVMSTGSDSMLIELHESSDPHQKSKSISFDVPLGSGPNQMEKPPDNYKDDDLKIHTASGAVVGAKDKIRVAGQFNYFDTGKGEHTAMLMAPIIIEKI